MKRTFIALPVEASGELISLTESLKTKLMGEDIKWADPGNLHITLKFLGNTSDRQLQEVTGKLETVGTLFRKGEGKMAGLDFFTYQGNPSVLFTRLTGLPELEAMFLQIDRELEAIGFPLEKRPFRPHLTLARIKGIRDKNRFVNLVKSVGSAEIQPVGMENIVFYESILRPQGPLYIPLKTILLKS
jgi:RNA 2',3'-cyclic 3'-phosphodiesterase